MKLKGQRRLAASVLHIGVNRVWIDHDRAEDIEAAITRQEIRKLVKEGAIRASPLKSVSRGRSREKAHKKRRGRRKGPGTRKGAKYSVVSRKTRWIQRIRAIRKRLRSLKERRVITVSTYRTLYRKAKGGEFKSNAEIEKYITDNNLRRRVFG